MEIRSLRFGDRVSEHCEYWTGEVDVGSVPSCRDWEGYGIIFGDLSDYPVQLTYILRQRTSQENLLMIYRTSESGP